MSIYLAQEIEGALVDFLREPLELEYQPINQENLHLIMDDENVTMCYKISLLLHVASDPFDRVTEYDLYRYNDGRKCISNLC